MEIQEGELLVSICIPVYNCQQFIGQAIQSVLDQTFSDFELLIIDNCSDDNTLGVVSQFNDSRIRLIINEINFGMEGNFNKALKEAKGKFVKILPADDLLYPDCIAKQLAAFQYDENIALVCTARKVIDENSKVIIYRKFKGGLDGIIPSSKAIKLTVRSGTNLFGEPAAVLMKKSIIDKVGFFDSSIYYIIDLDYWIRLLEHGDLFFISEPLVAFRVSKNSTSVSLINKQSRDFGLFIDRLQKKGLGLTGFDIWIGKINAFLNALLRLIFYKIILK